MIKRICALMVLLALLATGCAPREPVKEDGYEHLIGVSLSNVVEPWLNHIIDGMTAGNGDDRVNIIFKDAAGNSQKQADDIDQLMKFGVDLLVVAPNDPDVLKEKIKEVHAKIPVIALGIEPGTADYTAFIEFDDYEIGTMAGVYILDEHYQPGDKIVVIEGLSDSPISAKRLEGFQEAVLNKARDAQVFYLNGEWLRDKAENRMKDYLLTNQSADIVFAFNDEMAYGAYLAQNQYRVPGACFIGVDGFGGNLGGINLVERGILTATIQCSEMGRLAYDTALEILDGGQVDKHIVISPRLITA